MAEQHKHQSVQEQSPRSLSGVKHIIAIGSGKGGVGKSTVAVNLAVALAKTGAKVGVMDADIYGPSQPGMLGAGTEQPHIEGDMIIPMNRHGISFMSLGILMDEDKPVIWRAPIATRMIQQFIENVKWGDLDYLLVDLPPGTGDVQITLAQQARLTGAVIVTTPQQVALGVAKKGLQMFAQVKVPILGIIENMSGFVCPHCGKETAIFKSGGGKQMAETYGVNFLGGIPIDPELMASGDDGVPLMEKKANSPTVTAFAALAERFREVVAQGVAVQTAEPETMALSGDGNVIVTWKDQPSVTISARELRVNCPCAGCVDEESGQRTLDPMRVTLGITIGAINRVGRYGVNFQFSDGHNTGIYGYDYLQELGRRKNDASKQSFNV
ncbi:MAG: P-loop NTPase [candidate division Zixibacteria bacterium]|nr:P-loop NTPase [candidate division Zixibacteria bacterium]